MATVIGTLPFGASDASAFVLEQLPQLPSIPAITLDPAHLDVDSIAVETRQAIEESLTALGGRDEPIVMSLTGPVTLALALRRVGSHEEDAAQCAGDAVAQVGRWLVSTARCRAPEARVLLFLTEPALTNSMHPTFPLAPRQIERLLATVVEQLDGVANVGIQVSGRADWTLLLRTGIGVLAAPVGAQLEVAAAEIGRFLQSGGIMAWGAVPVDEPLGASAERLWKRLSETWCALTQRGVDPLLLRERSIITPAGSLESFGAAQVERVVDLAQDLASRICQQTLGVRLGIGA